MAFVTRKSARIAAFPDGITDDEDAGHQERHSIEIRHWNDGHRERHTITSDGPSSSVASVNGASTEGSQSRSSRSKPKDYDTPPTYTIDLSFPPAERYVEVARDFKDHILDLIGLFDEVVGTLQLNISLNTVHRIARLFLRRVYSSEQTAELRGISKAVGVEMYLLVCYNTLLDLFMGCTSGGVKVGDRHGRRMLHFRTLDWGMDALRKVVVQFEYVQKPHGEVIARTVTYVGFVGVLTGVRPNLSVSLNFRGHHNNTSSKWSNFRYYGNHLAILLGFRPSIASRLRTSILPKKSASPLLPNLAEITTKFPSTVTTSCFVIASDGDTTTVFEKDRATAVIRSSSSFITATNHDVACELDISHPNHPSKMRDTIGMQDLIDESIDRKHCVERKWKEAVTWYCKENPFAEEDDACVTAKELQHWMVSYPIANECTHYAVIMDPKKGKLLWCRRWNESLSPP